MLLIPIGQEDNTVRRLPWVTYGVMILCVVSFVLTGFGNPQMDRKASAALNEAVDYYFSHPYLKADPELEKLIFRDTDEETRGLILESAKSYAAKKPKLNFELNQQQDHLDSLTSTGLKGLMNHGFFKWGLVPSRISPLALVTHMFLHGGWGHIIGNLLILFLVGPFIEDVWGRPLFATFYLLSGLAAALSYTAAHLDSATPMIGASGAIAGVMGAFMIRHYKSRMRFFYMVGLIWRGTFMAPAWLMLALWLGEQVFMMLMASGLGIEGGVAYMAHVGGFAFGALVAVGIKRLEIEERFVNSAITDKITVINNAVIEEALAASRQGRADEAYAMLVEAWKQDPSNQDVALTLWDVAVSQQWESHAAPAMLRLIQDELRAKEPTEAANHWFEVMGRVPQLTPDPALCLRMSQLFLEGGQRDWALDALQRLVRSGAAKGGAAILLNAATLAQSLDPTLAVQATETVLAKADLHPEERARAEELAAALQHPVG